MVDRLGLARLGRKRRLLHSATYSSKREAPWWRTGHSRNAVNSGASNFPRSSVQLRTHLRGAWSAIDCSLKRVGVTGICELPYSEQVDTMEEFESNGFGYSEIWAACTPELVCWGLMRSGMRRHPLFVRWCLTDMAT